MKVYRVRIRHPCHDTATIWGTTEGRAMASARRHLDDVNGHETDETDRAYIESCDSVDIPTQPQLLVEWLNRHMN